MLDRLNPESIADNGILVLLALAILFVYSFFVEPGLLTVRHLEIKNTGVQMKVVFMSDFQRGSSDPAFIARAVELANREDADIILLGGDFVDSGLSELPSIAPLQSLRARYGVYGVLGNHDYGMASGRNDPRDDAMAADVRAFLEEGNITILGNEHVSPANVTIIGLDDQWARKRDVAAAISGNLSGYRILVSHNQQGLVISDATANLYLFGHTHCGMVRLPVLGSVPELLDLRSDYGDYQMGRYTVNGSDVYVTCGLSWGPRFLAPPEVTVIEIN